MVWIPKEEMIFHNNSNSLVYDLKNVILLDTGSTFGETFIHPDLVANIHPIKIQLE